MIYVQKTRCEIPTELGLRHTFVYAFSPRFTPGKIVILITNIFSPIELYVMILYRFDSSKGAFMCKLIGNWNECQKVAGNSTQSILALKVIFQSTQCVQRIVWMTLYCITFCQSHILTL